MKAETGTRRGLPLLAAGLTAVLIGALAAGCGSDGGAAGADTAASTQAVAKAPAEAALVVHFQYGSRDLARLFALEDRLEQAIADAGVGEYDGHEIAMDGADGFLYIFGPDAEAMLRVAEPILAETAFTQGATVELRSGSTNSEGLSRTVTIGR